LTKRYSDLETELETFRVDKKMPLVNIAVTATGSITAETRDCNVEVLGPSYDDLSPRSSITSFPRRKLSINSAKLNKIDGTESYQSLSEVNLSRHVLETVGKLLPLHDYLDESDNSADDNLSVNSHYQGIVMIQARIRGMLGRIRFDSIYAEKVRSSSGILSAYPGTVQGMVYCCTDTI
jgi:hypothetical protein